MLAMGVSEGETPAKDRLGGQRIGTLQNQSTRSRRRDCRDFANEREVCIVCQDDPRRIFWDQQVIVYHLAERKWSWHLQDKSALG